jgi:hypothetical protein
MSRKGWRDRVRTGALALVVFALAHNVTFLVTYDENVGAALARTGHGTQWTATVVLVAILAAVLAVAGAVRIVQLSRLAHELDGPGIGTAGGGSRDLARHVIRAWLQVFACSLVVFVAAENLEHVSAGLSAPGLNVLGSGEYHLASVVFAACALAAALVEALYRWRRDVLVALIAASRSGATRNRSSGLRPRTPWADRHHAAVTRHRIEGRAPPAAAR